MRDLPLPTYPKGGSVGIAAASEIMRCLRLATDELVGLMEQLDHHDQESPNDKLRHGGENQNV